MSKIHLSEFRKDGEDVVLEIRFRQTERVTSLALLTVASLLEELAERLDSQEPR